MKKKSHRKPQEKTDINSQKEIPAVFLRLVNSGFLRFVKIRKFQIIAGVVLLVSLSFFAGIGLVGFISMVKNNNGNKIGTQDIRAVTDTGKADTVVRGNIVEITLPLITVEQRTRGEVQIKLEEETVITSSVSDVVSMEDLKVGSVVSIYAYKDGNGNLVAEKIRITD